MLCLRFTKKNLRVSVINGTSAVAKGRSGAVMNLSATQLHHTYLLGGELYQGALVTLKGNEKVRCEP